MARTPKLNDLQLILLTTAAQRPDGSLLPPPDSVSEQHDRIIKAIASLTKRGLAAEAEGGMCISDAGREAIGLEALSAEELTPAERTPSADPAPPLSLPREGSKQALVVGLLARPQGATLTELIAATGWLPHTARAALTGFRKKGHAIRKAKRGEVTCYHLGEGA